VRSILREKTSDFFVMLQYDKADWLKFWNLYCSENREFMKGYIEKYQLNDEGVKEILQGYERPFLDQIKQKNEQIKHLKQATVKNLNKSSKELELIKEDFVIFLIGALGIEDVSFIERKDKHLILIDLVSLGKNQRIDDLQNIVLGSAYAIRDRINTKEKNLEEI